MSYLVKLSFWVNGSIAFRWNLVVGDDLAMTLNNDHLMIICEPRLVAVILSFFMEDLRDKSGYVTLKNEGEIPSESSRSRQAPVDPFTQKLSMTTWDILKVSYDRGPPIYTAFYYAGCYQHTMAIPFAYDPLCNTNSTCWSSYLVHCRSQRRINKTFKRMEKVSFVWFTDINSLSLSLDF